MEPKHRAIEATWGSLKDSTKKNIRIKERGEMSNEIPDSRMGRHLSNRKKNRNEKHEE